MMLAIQEIKRLGAIRTQLNVVVGYPRDDRLEVGLSLRVVAIHVVVDADELVERNEQLVGLHHVAADRVVTKLLKLVRVVGASAVALLRVEELLHELVRYAVGHLLLLLLQL